MHSRWHPLYVQPLSVLGPLTTPDLGERPSFDKLFRDVHAVQPKQACSKSGAVR